MDVQVTGLNCALRQELNSDREQRLRDVGEQQVQTPH